jgi:hypothetical protein
MDSSTGSPSNSFEPPKNQIEILELLERGTLKSSKLRIGKGLLLIDCASGCYSELRDSILAAIKEFENSGQEVAKEQAMLLQSVISCHKLFMAI